MAKRARKAENIRYRHMCKLQGVYMFMNGISESKKELLESTGFGAFMQICKWNRIPGEFVRWVSTNFEPEQCQLRLTKYLALPISSQDIERAYSLPNEGTTVNQLECKQISMIQLRKDFKWESKVPDIDRANVEELEKVIRSAKKDEIWCKAMILYLLGCFLCPDHNDTVSLKYASILEDLNKVSKYNWCKYVLEHLRKGTKGYTNPKSDMHFFMIHYIERMGRESPYSQGSPMPTLQGWDTVKVLRNLDAIFKLSGFGAGITSGYALRPEINLESPMSLVPLEADECPIENLTTAASVSRGNCEDKRDQSEAAQEFTTKLGIFDTLMPHTKLNVFSLEYILIPSIARSHFVTYMLNLKKRRFEYLTSLKRFPRIDKSGTFSEFELLGNKLMKEACSFISERYQVMKTDCPYKWEQFEWHDAQVPEQPDGSSCGVFTMMFLRDWYEDENEIDSFRNWNTLSKSDQVSATNKFRIDICCSIMKHKTNLLKETIQGEANTFCNELKARLKGDEGGGKG